MIVIEVSTEDAITCLNQVVTSNTRKTCGAQVLIMSTGQCPVCGGMAF